MPTAQQVHALITYFKKQYKNKYNIDPVFNRNVVKRWFEAILIDLDKAEAEGLIEYYFQTFSDNQHSIEWFSFNYDKLLKAMRKAEEDEEQLAELRAQSKKRAEEWRNKIDSNRTASS